MTLFEDILAEPESCEVVSDHFRAWWRFWGELDRIRDDVGSTVVYGFENQSDPSNRDAELPDIGACFGYVAAGSARLTDEAGESTLKAGQWFSTAGGLEMRLGEDTRLVVSQRENYRGLRVFGGPIERLGRLRYIDRCSDTLLACPPVMGDPCLNHLHFPEAIAQTEHWHPSVRTGTVGRGLGWCETPAGMSPLVPGMAFCIPAGGLHRFLTEAQPMDVIAYHPDSDWGPTDDDHPMVNRTWIGEGKKIDNRGGVHATADIEERWLRAPMVR